MKKFIVILIIAVIACTSVFAASDIQLGVMQNLVNTSLLVDAEFDRFGVEGSVGLPVVSGIIGGIGALFDKDSGESSKSSEESSEESSESETTHKAGFSILGGAMANVYWKAIAGEKFSLRLGIQGDMIGLVGTDGSRIFVTYGPSVGFNYKFNERFGVNFTSAIPAALILAPFGDEVSKYGGFYYNNVNTEGWGVIGEVVLALFGVMGGVGDELARVSFKWSI